MFSRNIPYNAYNVKCGNCSALFSFKDIKEYNKIITNFIKDEFNTKDELKKIIESREQINDMLLSKGGNDTKLVYLLKELDLRIKESQYKLQEFREARYSAKGDLAITNKFSDEGIYVCHVSHITFISIFFFFI